MREIIEGGGEASICEARFLEGPSDEQVEALLDLRDAKFERAEASGIDHLVAGIAMARKDHGTRLERGAAVFDDLYECFRRKRH